MLRGYRGIVVALVGLALVGAGEPPKRPEQSEKEPSQSELAKAAATVGTAISGLKIPVEENPPCKPGKDNRGSDLCAQWKAADAARNAAEYSFWTMLLGFGGTVLLVLTFWETRKTSRAELRAYIAVKPISLIFNKKYEITGAQICCTNDGQTPAFEYNVISDIVLIAEPELEGMIASGHIPVRGTKRLSTINGHATASVTSRPSIPLPEIKALKMSTDKGLGLFIYGVANYRDAFGKARKTQFCYRTSKMEIDQGAAPNGKVDWFMTHFHNDAT